jgi:hypothetical protein
MIRDVWDYRPDPNMNLEDALSYFFIKGWESQHGPLKNPQIRFKVR